MRNLVLAILVALAIVSMGAKPATKPSRGVPRVYRAIPYAQAGSRSLLLDLYLPLDTRSPVPVVVYIHGGDWMFGDRTSPPVLFLRDHNMAVASIDYRLAPRSWFPAQIQDCRDALVFLRDNAKRFGIDPQRMGVMGESAGGHLAALLATAPDEAQFVGTRKTPASPRVRALCSVSGPMDIEYLGCLADMVDGVIGRHPIQQLLGGTIEQKRSLARLASPIQHITPDTPPSLLIFGDQDYVVPPILNREMDKALQAAGVEVRTYEVKGMAHDMIAIWTPEVRQHVADFFVEHLANTPAATRPSTTQAGTTR